MGCDIHMVLERKYEGKWVGLHSYVVRPKAVSVFIQGETGWDTADAAHVSYRADSRNYSLFRALAGVRGESPFGNEPKGTPEDASDLAHMFAEEYGDDGHSHSWSLLPEFLKCYGWAKFGEDSEEHKQAALDAIAGKVPYAELFEEVTGIYDEDKPLTDYRIVYFFDN